MGVAVAHGKKQAASKHGFSFGGKVSASVTALSMLASDYLGIPNENASTDHHPSPFWTDPPCVSLAHSLDMISPASATVVG
jgi:hypothetical protein